MRIMCTVVGDLTKEHLLYLNNNKKNKLKFLMDVEFDTYDSQRP